MVGPLILPPPRRPFEGAKQVVAVPPTELAGLSPSEAAVVTRLPLQLAAEADQIARELGAPVVLEGDGPQWFIGPAANNPALRALGLPPATAPVHQLDPGVRLVTDAPDVAGVLQAFGGLRSLARLREPRMTVEDCHSMEEAVRRITVEVADTWPGARRVDWPEICKRNAWKVMGSTNPISAMQAWLAELGDLHTWVAPARTQLVLPYGAVVMGGEVVLTHVLPWTDAYQAGVRPGYRLVGEDVAAAWRTTPAAPHARPFMVARRLLSGAAGELRHLEARGPGAHTVRWSEPFRPPSGTPAAWARHPDNVGSLWIGVWVPGLGIEEVIEEALEELADADALVVDLRGNSGGRLAMAEAFRSRFLDTERTMGWIQWTAPGGRLERPSALRSSPADGRRWTRPVRFLTDPLSYSATEDALLGLSELPHVEVWGEPSGGGSGRVRRLRLVPGWRLTISSSITWDPRGRRVEGRGIHVDRPFVPDRRTPVGDPLFEAALRGW